MSSYDRHHPFLSKITRRYALNQAGASRQTWHFVLDLQGSNIEYVPGDSIGVLPSNDFNKVDRILHYLGYSGEEIIEDPKVGSITIRDFLVKKANLSSPTKRLLQEIANREQDNTKKENLQKLLEKENEESLKKYVSTFDVEDVLQAHQNSRLPPETIIPLLAPLLPRLYSIASSKNTVHDELHLTVARVQYTIDGKERRGVCSHFLCDLIPENEPLIPIYLQPTRDFRLPIDEAIPIIMIGPGTGVAPFRAFMQERKLQKTSASYGKNWLFFGERHRHTDFLYEHDWNEYISSGMLRLDTAFSRDQQEKIYVQNRMWENRQEFWRWLENGAIIYVCGDADHMAKDVDLCLHKIVESEGKLSEAGARDFVKTLRHTKRYIRDVY